MSRRRTAAEVAHRWVADEAAFAEVVSELGDVDRFGLDTEFHRERTYFAQLALVQLAWEGSPAVLVDPLEVDLAPLAAVLGESHLVVMHACTQDLEVLERACGIAPARIFDIQVAAGFVGYGTPSLSSLMDSELGRVLPKGDRLTDWLQRPLGDAQQDYAAADVAHLLELHDRLGTRLERLDRLQWVEDECATLLARDRSPQDPDTAWLRIKEARHLRGQARGIALELAAWRERVAAAEDQPVRFVLSDLGLVGIAQSPPADEEGLRKIRGVDGRHLRNGAAQEILAAVERGRKVPEDHVRPPARANGGLDRDLRPAVTLIAAWVSQFARNEGFDHSMLATRSDIESYLRGDRDSRLGSGWRKELLGGPITDLVEGKAALAFDRSDGLVLEPRVP